MLADPQTDVAKGQLMGMHGRFAEEAAYPKYKQAGILQISEED